MIRNNQQHCTDRSICERDSEPRFRNVRRLSQVEMSWTCGERSLPHFQLWLFIQQHLINDMKFKIVFSSADNGNITLEKRTTR